MGSLTLKAKASAAVVRAFLVLFLILGDAAAFIPPTPCQRRQVSAAAMRLAGFRSLSNTYGPIVMRSPEDPQPSPSLVSQLNQPQAELLEIITKHQQRIINASLALVLLPLLKAVSHLPLFAHFHLPVIHISSILCRKLNGARAATTRQLTKQKKTFALAVHESLSAVMRFDGESAESTSRKEEELARMLKAIQTRLRLSDAEAAEQLADGVSVLVTELVNYCLRCMTTDTSATSQALGTLCRSIDRASTLFSRVCPKERVRPIVYADRAPRNRLHHLYLTRAVALAPPANPLAFLMQWGAQSKTSHRDLDHLQTIFAMSPAEAQSLRHRAGQIQLAKTIKGLNLSKVFKFFLNQGNADDRSGAPQSDVFQKLLKYMAANSVQPAR